MMLAESLSIHWIGLILFLLTLGFSTAKSFWGLIEDPPKLLGRKLGFFSFLILSATLFQLHLQGTSLLSSFGASLFLMSWTLLFLELIINTKLNTPLVPVMTHPLILALTASGLRFGSGSTLNSDVSILKYHIVFIILAYVIIFLASVSSVLFLIQDLKLRRRLKSKIPLPSLDLIRRLVRTFDIGALILLSAAIFLGAYSAYEHYGRGWSAQMPWVFYGVLITWTLLLFIVVGYFKKWLTGTKLAQANLILLALALLSLLGGPH